MKHHLNTLFVTTQGSYLAKEGEAVLVKVEKQTKLRVPIHNLGGIVCFGRVGLSASLMGLCGERGVAITMLGESGMFRARINGFTSGNVLLRREQYRRADDPRSSADIARAIVLAKVANSRSVLLRALRDNPDHPARSALESAALRMAQGLEQLQTMQRAQARGGASGPGASPPARDGEPTLGVQSSALDLRPGSPASSPGDHPVSPAAGAPPSENAFQSLDAVRGLEGEAANVYFSAFDHLIIAQKDGFAFRSRNRRPPLDQVNALLSFVYAILGHDARAACEAAGLDPQVGFLHRDRPGRAGLALDLMEEFRPYLADRLVLSLINRKQVASTGFTTTESGAVRMDDATRKTVLSAYQKRKQEQVMHPFLGETVSVGLLIHLQARLLARHLRGDADAYPAFIWR